VVFLGIVFLIRISID